MRPIFNELRKEGCADLWIGNVGDLRDFKPIYDAGIKAVIQLAYDEAEVVIPRDLISIRVPLVDGSGNDPVLLNQAVAAVDQLIERSISTLVTCGSGLSRSPSVAAVAMAWALSIPATEAMQTIASEIGTDVSTSLWNELLAACNLKR